MVTKEKRTIRFSQSGQLTVADVHRVMEPATKNKEAALAFLKSIGVTFTRSGKVQVKPIIHQ